MKIVAIGIPLLLLLLSFLQPADAQPPAYQEGVSAFNRHDFTGAIRLFSELLEQSPPLDYLDNVHFWIGEARFARGEYLEALYHFEQVFAVAGANKRHDALLKTALCYWQLGNASASCAVLYSLDELYESETLRAKRTRLQRRYCLNPPQ